MRKTLVLFGFIVIAAAVPALQMRTATRLVFKSMGHLSRGGTLAVSSDGNRFYFPHDSTSVSMYDRRMRRESKVFDGKVTDLALSPSGTLLAFSRRGESGDGPYVTTIALDAVTGLAAGTPRRVSLTPGESPAFSPDGNSIAFAAVVSDSLSRIVVAPVAGGPERELVRTEGFVAPIQWTPDGRFIYYNTTMRNADDSARTGTYRIPAGGGQARLVVRTADGGGGAPGLSPDGTRLLFWDPSWDTTVVTDADGRRIASYVLSEEESVPIVWHGNTSGFSMRVRSPSVLHIQSLQGGTSRPISDTSWADYAPRWSPDGTQIASLASIHYSGAPFRVLVSSADGSQRRRFLSTFINPTGFAWSPDGKSLAYRTVNGTALTVMDASTGSKRELAAPTSGSLTPKWRSDSRAIFYSTSEVVEPASDSIVAVTVHEMSMTGERRALRTVRMWCPSVTASCQLLVVNDSTLVTWSVPRADTLVPREYRLLNLRRQDTGRVLHSRGPGRGQPYPSFSANGQWMALREDNERGEKRIVDVISLEGRTKTRVNLSFDAATGTTNPWISPDGRTLIVASAPAADSVMTYYRVDVSSGRSTRVAAIKATRQYIRDYAVSPDGRSLAFTRVETPYTAFFEMDLTRILNGTAPR